MLHVIKIAKYAKKYFQIKSLNHGKVKCNQNAYFVYKSFWCACAMIEWVCTPQILSQVMLNTGYVFIVLMVREILCDKGRGGVTDI